MIDNYIRSQKEKSKEEITKRLREYGYSSTQINQAFSQAHSREKLHPLTPKPSRKIGEHALAIIALLLLSAFFISLPSTLNLSGFAVAQDCSQNVSIIQATCIGDYVEIELSKTTQYTSYLINNQSYPARSIKNWKRVIKTSSPITVVPISFGYLCEEKRVTASCSE
ncbi:hypothetical protein D6774_02505 [Candidatus Woesearchaeota archaeon]|nr:MAG: hypothetical protein D6774_02505 [Candidatus Woesearchaeota archaeon]